MSDIERLKAAIAKLERQADTYSQRPWAAWKAGHPSRQRFGIEDARGDDLATVRRAEDAELIVTLHRTIDAQLAILREAVRFGSSLGYGEPGARSPQIDGWFALAAAILGGDS